MKKILFLLLVAATAQAQLQKIEPPFWYAGMQHSDLQIMCYAPNVAQYTVSASGGVIIKNIQKTENPNYLFVTVDTKNLPPQTFDLNFTSVDSKKPAFKQSYELKKRRENSRLRKGFDASDVVYLIMSDRFANGNPANDSSTSLTEKADRANPGGRHGGDIQGMIDHLDYLQQLGVTALWPTPLCEDNDTKYSYHTYGQSDVYKIDARYGTNEEYVALSKAAHEKGIKLIMDYVTNHWGAEHWMYKDLPTYDWIHQFPGYAQSNYHMTTQFDTNASDIDRKYCLDGWFVRSMPDLNQSNPLMLNYLIQNALWWIEYADLDGFRVDTYSYNDKQGIAKWTKALTDEYPYFNIVGEVWMHDQAQMSYWQKDSKIGAIESFNSYLPSVMDFTLHDALGTVFNENNAAWDKGLIKVYDNFTNDFLYPNPNNIMTFLENHDTNRFNEIYKNDFQKYQMGLTLIATTRGIPQLYYGSEIGMSGNKDKGDADIRRDFPGGWKGDANNAFTASGRTAEQNKFFDFTSKLLNWRKKNAAVQFGKLKHYIPENNVYVYFRYTDDQSVMVLINNSDQKQSVKTHRFAESIQNHEAVYDVLSQKRYPLPSEMSLDAKSVLILELK